MRARFILVGLLALALAAPTAWANHVGNQQSGQYSLNPVEHDDQGTSHEPDGESSIVFTDAANPLVNAVIDLNFDGYADLPVPLPLPGKGNDLAPGCTNPAGTRVAAGQCGIWTIGAGEGIVGNVVPRKTVNIPGFTVITGSCPGRYGNQPVVMLDQRVELAVSSPSLPGFWYSMNQKVQDVDETTGGLLSQAGVQPGLFGPVAHWAWYGRWQDVNCNGVIDALQNVADDPSLSYGDNEFVWYGSCINDDGAFHPEVITGGYCQEDVNPNANPPAHANGDARTTMHWYVWPGDHFNSFAPDLPTHFLEPAYEYYWDLLGDDRTGETAITTRQWVGGVGFSQWYYDQSVIMHTEIATAVNCKENVDIEQLYDLGVTGGPGSPCTFIDVDKYASWTPLLEPIVKGLKDTAYNTYTTITDLIPTTDDQGPIQRLANSLIGYDFYQNTLGPQQGTVGDILAHSGWGHEPNVGPTQIVNGPAVQDRYADALNPGICDKNPLIDDRDEQFFGWCNVNTNGEPSAYAAYQGADFRGWVDARPLQVAAWVIPIGLMEGACIWCFSIVQMVPIDQQPLPYALDPADPSDHHNTLLPGQWVVGGWMGRWKDIEHSADESVFPTPQAAVPCDEDPSQSVCVTYPKDGWNGFLDNGAQQYQGYLPEVCATYQPPTYADGKHSWKECHPYIDGNTDDSDCLFTALDPERDCNFEFQAACELSSTDVVHVYPQDGTWSIPVIVWREYKNGIYAAGDPPDLDIHLPGDTRVAELRMEQCLEGYKMRTVDHLFLPVGNIGEDIVTVFSAEVGVSVAGLPAVDVITDVDIYGRAVI